MKWGPRRPSSLNRGRGDYAKLKRPLQGMLKIRFLADANFNQRIVSGLLLHEPRSISNLLHGVIRDRMSDLQVLELGTARGRIIVTHEHDARLVSALRGGLALSEG